MPNSSRSTQASRTAVADQGPAFASHLRLYIAGSTPNSARAEHNLKAALASMATAPEAFGMEIIDVLTDARRAMHDGVIVTPTLIGLTSRGRTTIIGDLTDPEPLRRLLAQLASSSATG